MEPKLTKTGKMMKSPSIHLEGYLFCVCCPNICWDSTIVEEIQEPHRGNGCNVYIYNHTLHYIHTKKQACDIFYMASVLALNGPGFHFMFH